MESFPPPSAVPPIFGSIVANAAALGVTISASQISVTVGCQLSSGRRLAVAVPTLSLVFNIVADASSTVQVGAMAWWASGPMGGWDAWDWMEMRYWGVTFGPSVTP
jgi:hypothetical protein